MDPVQGDGLHLVFHELDKARELKGSLGGRVAESEPPALPHRAVKLLIVLYSNNLFEYKTISNL